MASMGADDDKIGRPKLCFFTDCVANALCQVLKNEEFCVDFDSGLMDRRCTRGQQLLARLAHCLLIVSKQKRGIHRHISRGFINHVNKAKRRLLFFG